MWMLVDEEMGPLIAFTPDLPLLKAEAGSDLDADLEVMDKMTNS
jgi:hypothetical protein